MMPEGLRTLIAFGLLLLAGPLLLAQFGGPVVPRQSGDQAVWQPVYIEDSPAAQDLADAALELRDLGRLTDAAQKLQQLIEVYPHKLMPVGGQTYTDAVRWARGEILRDDRLLSAYRQSFGPAAERLVEQAMPTGDAPINVEGLEGVVSRYNLTPAGLEAGLALGAHYLERAEGRDASGVLDELTGHPDLPHHAGRYHFLRALAAMLTGERDVYEAHRRVIVELADRAHLGELDAVTHRVHPPLRLKDEQVHQEPDPPGLPNALAAPLWEVQLTGEQRVTPGNRADLRGLPAGLLANRIQPAGDALRLYLNQGDRVTAYDRASGWRLWGLSNLPLTGEGNRTFPHPGWRMTEPRGVLTLGDRGYAVLGWSNPKQGSQSISDPGVSLVGFDLPNGREAWRVRAWDLDESLAKGSFEGTPAGSDRRVYTLVKRTSVAGLQDLYLTAVDVLDGGLIWRRHLSSSAGQQGNQIGLSASMVLYAGRIYVSDQRGAVASIDGRTGTVLWITLLPKAVPKAPNRRYAVTPLPHLGSPVIVEAGLIVPPHEQAGPHMLLDVQTGRPLRKLDGEAWTGVEKCYAVQGGVLGVGESVTRFDGRTLEPVWHTPLDPDIYGRPLGRPAIEPRMTVDPSRPEADQAGGLMVMCTERRLVSLRLDDGAVVSDQPLSEPGNVMLSPGQVVIASGTWLGSFMDWPVAENQLRARAGQDMSDPTPGLALAQLALKVGHEQAVLDGVDMAISAVSHVPAGPQAQVLQQEVFDRLRGFADPSNGGGESLRGELLDRMATTASTPGQEVAYQITRGLFLEARGEPRRAAEHFQAVLADRSLSDELYTVGRGSRRAGLEARQLLEALIRAHGREVYHRFDLLAEHELSELLAKAERDPHRYIGLADRYPLAHSATGARRHAAGLLIEAGDGPGALRQWQLVYLSTPAGPLLSEVAGKIVQLHLDAQHPELARRWLRRVDREHPDLILIRSDQPVSVQSWLSELRHLISSERSLAQIDLPLAEPRLIEGRPMPVKSSADMPPEHSRVLMRVGRSIQMRVGPTLEQAWEAPLPAPDAEILSLEDRQVIWWSAQTNTLGAMDSRTGEALWPTVDVAAVLQETGDTQVRLEARTQQQQQFIRFLGGPAGRRGQVNPDGIIDMGSVLTAVDLSVVCLADRIGRVVCIDRATGQVLWSRLSSADRLNALALGDGLLALGGVSWADTQAQSGVISILDVLTGEPLGLTIESDEAPTWLGIADNGLVLSASLSRAVAYEPATGRTVWRQSLDRSLRLGGLGWVGERTMILASSHAQVISSVVLDIDDGRVINHLASRMASQGGQPFSAFQADGGWHLISPMQAVALDESGRTSWRDAISGAAGHLTVQLVSDQYVLLIGRSPAGPGQVLPRLNMNLKPGAERALRQALLAGNLQVLPGSYRLYVLDRRTGVIKEDLPLDGLPGSIDPASCLVLDGVLLLGAGEKTLVLGPVNQAD